MNVKILISAASISIVAIFAVQCSVADKGKGSGISSSSSSDLKAKDCSSLKTRICPRIYIPAKCTYDGETYYGSNECTATSKAEYAVCQAGKEFDEKQLKCERVSSPIEIKPGKDCEAIKSRFCTKEYDPTECTYGKETFKGDNKCAAMIDAEYSACKAGREFDAKEVVCKQVR
ncbi:MAG: hypothetical protein HQK54_17435 [Oligoflexales bacterium]|nr:hypothetical protein [Oligoflexales bacterium]